MDTTSPIRSGAAVAWSRLELGVWFDYDSAALRPEALATLAELTRTLRAMDGSSVLEVVGHTDSTGSWYYNQDLSERRASSVRQTLLYSGIDRNQVTMRGAGEGDPAASNGTSWGRARNRRVEFRFYRPIAYVTR